MTHKELEDLACELDTIRLTNHVQALAKLRSILSAVIDHLLEQERR